MIKIKSILMSGGACPYQIEAITDDDKYLYLRYRGGFLRCSIANSSYDFWKVENWEQGGPYNIINNKINDDLDGCPDNDLFHKILDNKIVFPNDFKFEY